MDEAMTHDRCSELLRGYVRGELPREVAGEVREHLGTCADCRAEEQAVAALAVNDAVDARPLDDVERARLHRGLAQELFLSRANTDVAGAGSGGRRWVRWIAPAAAAAAVVGAVVVMTLGGGVDDAGIAPLSQQDGGADAGAGGGVEDSSEALEAHADDKPGRHRSSSSAAVTGEAAGAGGEQADFAGPDAPRPVFDPDRGKLTDAELAEIGRGHPFDEYANAYEPSDGPGLYDRSLDVLKKEAVGIGPQIDECAATLPQDGSIVPVYATVGQYDGRNALVLGFVSSDPGSRELDRFLMWVWEMDDCEQPIDTLFGRIGPG